MRKRRDPIRLLGFVILALSFLIFLGGYIYQYGFCLSLNNLVQDFYANASSELASIAITVLIIDYLSERRAERSLRQQLAREMGSKDNAFATKATKELRAHGWLTDGSLNSVDLGAADLTGIDLSNADLSKAILSAATLNRAYLVNAKLIGATITGASIEDADLSNVDMSNADLRWSDLSNADFNGAILNGADLEGSALDGAKITREQLKQIKNLTQAIMPDGRRYEEWAMSQDI